MRTAANGSAPLTSIQAVLETILQHEALRTHLQQAALEEHAFRKKQARDRDDATVHAIMNRMTAAQPESRGKR